MFDSFALVQVIEVIFPMLCNYLSYWWEKGPENSPPDAKCCTMVTSEHLSIILGNILRILNNNLGIDEAPWMKRIAGMNSDTLVKNLQIMEVNLNIDVLTTHKAPIGQPDSQSLATSEL